MVVNQTAADVFWGGQNVVGRRIRPQAAPDAWRRVVGVVSDANVRSLSEPPTPMIYYLMGASGTDAPYAIVRTAGDPSFVLSNLRSELATVSARLPVVRLATFESHLGEGLAIPRLSAGLLGLFSFLALCLASVGIYTIVSFSVAGRRREVGIRVALGAAKARVIRTVVSEVAWTVAIGLVLGGAAVAAVSPLLGRVIFGPAIFSFGTMGVAVLVLGIAVGVASFIPAWRAVQVDPAEALRGTQ